MNQDTYLHVLKRRHAQKIGLKRYFTGKPCSQGHISERYTCDKKCVACHLDISRKRYENHSESINAGRRGKPQAPRVFTPKQVAVNSERRRLRYLRDKKKVARQSREYVQANKGKYRERRQRRRAAELNSIPSWFGELDDFVITEASALAEQRKAETGINWHVDHMIPLQAKNACGLHCAENIQVIPEVINLHKLNRLMFTEPGSWVNYMRYSSLSNWGDYEQ